MTTKDLWNSYDTVAEDVDLTTFFPGAQNDSKVVVSIPKCNQLNSSSAS